MRILFVTRSLDVGGAERQLLVLAKGLVERGHQVGIACFYPGQMDQEAVSAGIALLHLKKKGRWDVVGFLRQLRKVIQNFKPDIAHSYLVTPNIILGFLGLMGAPYKTVWGVRASNMHLEHYDWLARLTFSLSSWLSRVPHLIIANSHRGMEYHSHFYPGEKIKVVHNGIDVNKFNLKPTLREEFRREEGMLSSEIWIGCVARIQAIKDHPTLLKGFAYAFKRNPNLRLYCVGSGAERLPQHLAALISELHLETSVRWREAVKPIEKLYNGIDILALSSLSEGSPNVVCEAMACGKPCVVTRAGDAPEIVGSLGFAVETQDWQAMGEAFLKLAHDLSQFPPEMLRRRIVNEYSVERLITETEKLLEKTLST